MKILIINCGSSSLKYQKVDTETKEVEAEGNIERVTSHSDAVAEVMSKVDTSNISAVGHRVVHGGEKMVNSVIVDDKVLAEMERISHLAPLHNPAHIIGVKECMKCMPNIKNILVFDTAFHSTMKEEAFLYGIPYEDYENHGIRKYGFHGVSHKYVAGEAAKMLGKPLEELKLISCHLGNGASICAIEGGKSIDTSMGMTPLAGLIMGTRSGDIDPAIIPALCKAHNFSVDEAITYLNKECGLKGVSGVGSDMRDIKAALETNKRAKLANTMFNRRITSYIGSYVAQLKGCDAIIWTGGIGIHNAEMVKQVMSHFEFLPDCKSLVIKTNEELEIALECEKVLSSK